MQEFQLAPAGGGHVAKLSGSGTALRFLGRWQACCEGDCSLSFKRAGHAGFFPWLQMWSSSTNMRWPNRARRTDIYLKYDAKTTGLALELSARESWEPIT